MSTTNSSSTPQLLLLSLGSNLGNRFINLRRAISALEQSLEILSVSSIYVTAPWGPIHDQPMFFNIALAAKTSLEPAKLLSLVKSIEETMGREATDKWGPRLIDIDILYLGETIHAEERLHIPHPQIEKRAFVLIPLAEIAAKFVDPKNGKSVREMVNALPEAEISSVTQNVDVAPLYPSPILKRPPHGLVWGERTYLMGILNITPDSFSGDGLGDISQADLIEAAVAQAEQFVSEGADMIDIGGESTRPGFEIVDAQMEIDRVKPVVEAVRSALPETVISIDTYRAETARVALAAGADWINDIWGLQHDPQMVELVAETGVPVIMMHNGRNRPRLEKDDGAGGYYGYFHYDDLIKEIIDELSQAVNMALSKGVKATQIILDPGIGFGKTAPQNLTLLNRLNEIKRMGYPMLLGTSRKGFIGTYSGNLPVEERIEGTAATVALGIASGADIVRVHDVKAMSRVVRMTDRIVRMTT